MNRKEFLYLVAKQLPSGPKVAEIGILRGHFSAKIYEALSPSLYYMIDPWRVFPSAVYEDYREYEQSHWDAICEKVRDKFEGEPGIRILRTTSLEAAAQMPPASLDFIYLDGNHSYEAVREDLPAWYRILKPGGIMAGHDWDLPGVRKAVEEFREGLILQGAVVNLRTTNEATCQTYWWRK